MRHFAIALVCLAGATLPAWADEACPSNPDAIGTSRTITVDPATLPRIGNIQYRHTLPLEDHEVVITFDDGPLPQYSNRVLDTLAEHCVKVTYFLVGNMARAYPDTVRRMYNAGHVIGTHSLSHPFTFHVMGEPSIVHEVNGGIAYVQAALGDAKAVAPFFRIPGLARSKTVENYLAAKSLAVWSADEVADDWHRGITAKDIVRLALKRIEAHDHRGVLLLHDIHPATALALPTLLKELKARGYKIVQAVPPGERLKVLPERPATLMAGAGGWPRVLKNKTVTAESAANSANKTAKASHRRKYAVRNDGENSLVDKLAKKKSKAKTAQTAQAERGFFSFWQ